MAFTEFSTEGLVGLPAEFFTEVLPVIALPSELKVTLHIFYRLRRQRGTPRRISWDELLADQELRQGLRAVSSVRRVEELLAEGLEAAVQRTTLLHLAQPSAGRLVNWYLVHTASNRAWIEQMAQTAAPLVPNDEQPSAQRPSLMKLYEQNIGLITPLLLDELREVEETYPYEWVEEAMREAVRANVRSWRYVRKVLEKWGTHGRQHATSQLERHRPIDVEKYTNGVYGALFRRGNEGNTGD